MECLTEPWFPVKKAGSGASLQLSHPGSNTLGSSTLGKSLKCSGLQFPTTGCGEDQVTDSTEST